MFKFNMFSVCLVAFWAVFQVVTSFRCPLQNCGFLLFKYWPFVNLKIWLIIQGLAKKRRPGIQIGTDSTFIIICAAACRLPPAVLFLLRRFFDVKNWRHLKTMKKWSLLRCVIPAGWKPGWQRPPPPAQYQKINLSFSCWKENYSKPDSQNPTNNRR